MLSGAPLQRLVAPATLAFIVILVVLSALGRCLLRCLGFRRRGVLRGMCSGSMMDLFC